MSDSTTVIKEIQAKFTADIGAYKAKMNELSKSISGVDGKLEHIKRKARVAMVAPSNSVQKLGRALDASASKLQRSQREFENLTQEGERTAQKIAQVSQKLAQAEAAYNAIKKAAASGIDLSKPLQEQANTAKASLDKLNERLNDLKLQLAHIGNYVAVFDGSDVIDVSVAKERVKELENEAAKAEEKFQRLNQAINEIDAETLEIAKEKDLTALEKQIESSRDQLERLSDRLRRTGQQAQDTADKVRQNKQAFDQLSKSISKTTILYKIASATSRGLGGILAKVKDKILGIGRNARSSTGRIEGLLRSIRRISLADFALRLTHSLFGELGSAVTRYMDTNDAAAASITRLRNGLTNALAPAINLVVNLLGKVMPYLIGIVDAVASLITNIFGEGWVSVSTGAGAAADATKDVADATKDAASAQKEYNKLIAGFDEIEKLDKPSNSGGSGTGGGAAKQDKAEGTEGIAGKLPKWLESLIHDIDGLLEKGNFYGIGARISETLNNATKAVDDWFNNVLRPKGVLWAGRFADVFNGLVEGYDWGLLGTTISDGFLAAIDIAGTFLRNARFESLGKGIATGINKAIKRINESDINFGSFLADLLNAGIRGLSGFANTLKWSKIGAFIANNVNKFFAGVDWGKAGRTAGQLIHGLGEILSNAIGQISWGDIAKAFKEFIDGIEEEAPWFSGIAKAILEIWAAATALKEVLGGMKVAKSVLETLKLLKELGLLGGGASGAASAAGSVGGGLKALGGKFATGGLVAAGTWGASQFIQGINGLRKTLFGNDKEKKEAKESAKNSFWYKPGKAIADALNERFATIDTSGNKQANQRKIYTEGAKRRLSNQSGKVAENTQKATEKNAKTSSDGWNWLKRVTSVASAVAGRTSGSIKTVSTINQTGKNTQTVGVKLAQDGWGSVGDWVQEHIGDPVAKAVGLGQDKWESVGGWVKEHLGGGVSKVIGLGKDGWSLVSNWVKEHLGGGVSKAIGLVKDKWSSVKEWVNDHAGGAVSKLVSLAKNGWSTVSGWIGTAKNTVQAKVSLVKNGWKTLSSFIGSFTKSIGLKVTWSKATGLKGSIGKVLFGSAKWPSLKFAARGGIVDAATLFGNTVVGEAGKEAIIPLERNTEWTGQVAKLLARHLYDLPQPIAPSTYSADSTLSSSDVAELVSLLRGIRSDVAAVKQSGGGVVTVNTNLDGRTIAQNTIHYINHQAKATGVNPLAAYM